MQIYQWTIGLGRCTTFWGEKLRAGRKTAGQVRSAGDWVASRQRYGWMVSK